MSLATIGLVSSLVGGATFAVFTDEDSNTANTFTAGTLDINVNEVVDNKVSFSNLAPGDSGTTDAFTVSNDGTLELRFDIKQTLTGSLVKENDDKDLAVTLQEQTDGTWANVSSTEDIVLAPDELKTYRLSYSFPLAADDTYQGGTASYQVTFNAEQTRNQ